jgi:DNA invertase Pin-like site-specific DNA recombinase
MSILLTLSIQKLDEYLTRAVAFCDSSTMGTSRKGLDHALSHLRRGDTLAVWKLDLFSRTVKQLVRQPGVG